MASNDFHLRRQLGRCVVSALTVAVLAVVIWAGFHWLVTDPKLLLDYVEALTWPLVVLLGAFWLRAPIRAKAGQVLRLEGFGASVAFQESPVEQLGRSIQGDVDELGLSQPRGEDEDAPDSTVETAAAAAVSVAIDHEVVQPSTDMPEQALAQMIDRIAIILNLSDSTRKELRADLQSDPQLAGHKIALEIEQREAVGRHTPVGPSEEIERRRDSVESIIRNSAAWGYDLGRSGAPKTVPDIHWSSDGTWRITTEVPPTGRSRQASAGADQVREIRELVDEIKSIKKKQHGSVLAMTSIEDLGWLSELKRRLRMVDPGNPWARD